MPFHNAVARLTHCFKFLVTIVVRMWARIVLRSTVLSAWTNDHRRQNRLSTRWNWIVECVRSNRHGDYSRKMWRSTADAQLLLLLLFILRRGTKPKYRSTTRNASPYIGSAWMHYRFIFNVKFRWHNASLRYHKPFNNNCLFLRTNTKR